MLAHGVRVLGMPTAGRGHYHRRQQRRSQRTRLAFPEDIAPCPQLQK